MELNNIIIIIIVIIIIIIPGAPTITINLESEMKHV
jgi:hypothetical protein